MKAKLGNAEIEGTPEEIAHFLGIKYSPEPLVEYDPIPMPCKACPNYGKGPCNCILGGYQITY